MWPVWGSNLHQTQRWDDRIIKSAEIQRPYPLGHGGRHAYKFIIKLDLSKGYWPIALSDHSKPYTAFQTPLGLFQFTVLPFGLVTAQASYSRLMRKLLQNLSNVENFVDDIIIFTLTWQQHIETLRALLQRLRKANLTMKPVKCLMDT